MLDELAEQVEVLVDVLAVLREVGEEQLDEQRQLFRAMVVVVL